MDYIHLGTRVQVATGNLENADMAYKISSSLLLQPHTHTHTPEAVGTQMLFFKVSCPADLQSPIACFYFLHSAASMHTLAGSPTLE